MLLWFYVVQEFTKDELKKTTDNFQLKGSWEMVAWDRLQGLHEWHSYIKKLMKLVKWTDDQDM